MVIAFSLQSFNMNCIPRKRISNLEASDEGECISKRTFKLSTKLKSIAGHQHDSWTVQKAHDRTIRVLHLLRSFLMVILSLFKDDVKKYQIPSSRIFIQIQISGWQEIRQQDIWMEQCFYL